MFLIEALPVYEWTTRKLLKPQHNHLDNDSQTTLVPLSARGRTSGGDRGVELRMPVTPGWCAVTPDKNGAQ